MSFRLLATIKVDEEAIGGRKQVFVLRQIVRSQGDAAGEFGHQFRPFPIWKRIEFVEQFLGGLDHEIRLAFCHLRVKFAGSSKA
jgi:hypothetical protein